MCRPCSNQLKNWLMRRHGEKRVSQIRQFHGLMRAGGGSFMKLGNPGSSTKKELLRWRSVKRNHWRADLKPPLWLLWGQVLLQAEKHMCWQPSHGQLWKGRTEHSCRQNYTEMGRQGWVWCLDGQNVVLGRSLRFVGISANSQSWFALPQWSPNVQRENAHEKRALPITHWPCGLRQVF